MGEGRNRRGRKEGEKNRTEEKRRIGMEELNRRLGRKRKEERNIGMGDRSEEDCL